MVKRCSVNSQKIDLNLNTPFNKHEVKRRLNAHHERMLQAQLVIARDKTLKYFDNDCAQVDHIYNNWRHTSWLKLRVEGIYLFAQI